MIVFTWNCLFSRCDGSLRALHTVTVYKSKQTSVWHITSWVIVTVSQLYDKSNGIVRNKPPWHHLFPDNFIVHRCVHRFISRFSYQTTVGAVSPLYRYEHVKSNSVPLPRVTLSAPLDVEGLVVNPLTIKSPVSVMFSLDLDVRSLISMRTE